MELSVAWGEGNMDAYKSSNDFDYRLTVQSVIESYGGNGYGFSDFFYAGKEYAFDSQHTLDGSLTHWRWQDVD